MAGGALAGVVVALLTVNEGIANNLKSISAEHGLTSMFGAGGYQILGVLFFVFMAYTLYHISTKKQRI